MKRNSTRQIGRFLFEAYTLAPFCLVLGVYWLSSKRAQDQRLGLRFFVGVNSHITSLWPSVTWGKTLHLFSPQVHAAPLVQWVREHGETFFNYSSLFYVPTIYRTWFFRVECDEDSRHYLADLSLRLPGNRQVHVYQDV